MTTRNIANQINIEDGSKKLPPYLVEERNKLMRQLQKRGFNEADVARVFRVSRTLAHEVLVDNLGPEHVS